MTHRLVLLRHAKAEHGLDVPDVQRPLTTRGRRQSAEVGTALAAAGLVPDLVLCSPSVRTRQTWQLAQATLHAEPEVEFPDELYDAGVEQVLAAVRAADEAAGVVLVVGHEPAMSRTAAALAGLSRRMPVRTAVLATGISAVNTALAVIDATLMVKFARKGPDGLGIWPAAEPDVAAHPAKA